MRKTAVLRRRFACPGGRQAGSPRPPNAASSMRWLYRYRRRPTLPALLEIFINNQVASLYGMQRKSQGKICAFALPACRISLSQIRRRSPPNRSHSRRSHFRAEFFQHTVRQTFMLGVVNNIFRF
jgi:hypothetical protein